MSNLNVVLSIGHANIWMDG